MLENDAPQKHDFVQDSQALHRACQVLRQAGAFGFDTEFIRERTYVPQLCLIQVATADYVALIDPFGADLEEFWKVMASPKVQKVVHSGQQDMEMCCLSSEHSPAGVFDVQVAAGMVGLPFPLSYGKLVEQVLGVRLRQGKAFSDWSRRPLSAEQVHYAIEDVQHLVALRDHLLAALKKLHRQQWLADEMGPLESRESYVFSADTSFQRVRGWDRFGSGQLAVLRELVAWRETAAREANLPPRTFLRDEALKALCRQLPRTIPDLKEVRFFPRPLVGPAAPGVLAAIAKGLALPKSRWPRAAVAADSNKTLVDKVMAAGRSLCEKHQVSPDLFASRRHYSELVHFLLGPAGREDQLRLMRGWRKEFAAAELERVVREASR